MKYADTSWLRAANVSDVSLEQTTSALSFVELLNGLRGDETAYGRGRSAIQRSLQTTTIWKLPDELYCTCFEEFMRKCAFTEQRIEPLRDLLRIVVESQTLETFLDAEAKLPHEWKLEAFNEFDDAFAASFRQATEQGNRDVRKAFEDTKADEQSLIPAEVRNGSFQNFCKWFRDDIEALNVESTLHGFCLMVADRCGLAADERFVHALRASYDGSRDLFLRGFSYSCMSMMADMTTTGRNDELDLAHLLYLAPGDELLTKDKKMAGIAAAIGIKVNT